MRFHLMTLILTAPFALAGCGAGSVFDPPIVASMPNVETQSGFTYSGGPLFTSDGAYAIRVGDSGGNDARRGFLRFDLSSIPAGATIEDAELRIGQYSVVGTPYTSLGAVLVDHVTMGVNFDAADWGAAALAPNIGTLSSDSTLQEKSLNVTSRVLDDLNDGRTTSDFRLRFALTTDFDGANDYAEFNDLDDTAGNGQIPQLIVSYRLP